MYASVITSLRETEKVQGVNVEVQIDGKIQTVSARKYGTFSDSKFSLQSAFLNSPYGVTLELLMMLAITTRFVCMTNLIVVVEMTVETSSPGHIQLAPLSIQLQAP